MNKFCPICQMYTDRFRPFGEQKRPDAKCPNCGSLERHRLVWCYFQEKTNLFDRKPKSLLHIAPERLMGELIAVIPNLDYLSADIDSPLAMVKIDLTDIQYPAESFDIILCSHVLEHILDDRKAMAEMLRVLKPKGWVNVQVPIYGPTTFEDPSVTTPEDRLKFFGQEDHMRKYGRDIKTRLEEAGFQVKHERYARELSEETRTLYAVRDQDLFLCTKARNVWMLTHRAQRKRYKKCSHDHKRQRKSLAV